MTLTNFGYHVSVLWFYCSKTPFILFHFIISLREEIWAHTTTLTHHLFIEVSGPSQVNEQLYICVLGVYILSLSVILMLDFRTVPTVGYVLFLILLAFQSFNIAHTS